MSTEELNTLREEAAPLPPQPGTDTATEQTQAAQPDIPPEVISAMVKGGVVAVSGIACRRAGVSLLEDHEAAALADSIARLLEVYDVRPSDPKAAAWWALAATAGVIMVNRKKVAVEPPQPANDLGPEPMKTPNPAPAYMVDGLSRLTPSQNAA